MSCVRIPNGIICFANIDFSCPHCTKGYNDDEEKYLERINRNKCAYTKITCSGCKRKFGMTYDYTGKAVTFEL